MSDQPGPRQAYHLIEGTRFLEKMGRAGHDHQILLARRQPLERSAVELEHVAVPAADDEQSRRAYTGKRVRREIRPSAARHDRRDRRIVGRRDERGGGAGAGTEVAERQASEVRL